ncbi:hypothetical protein [Rubritalea tangerina]|uniref:hypothetical protein n=1 Tax=Rubritalea tangerina TaxID=430798 RepID=UPI00361FAF97
MKLKQCWDSVVNCILRLEGLGRRVIYSRNSCLIRMLVRFFNDLKRGVGGLRWFPRLGCFGFLYCRCGRGASVFLA